MGGNSSSSAGEEDNSSRLEREDFFENANERKRIASVAERYVGSRNWAQDVEKWSYDDDFRYPAGVPKCNLFVYDVICEATGSAPRGTWPLTAAQWASSDKIPDWKYMGTWEEWKPGDVIAKKVNYTNATGHCGIAVSSTEVVAGGTNIVSRGTHDLTGCTVRRYTGD